jgi:hypothetical protein
MAGKEDGFPKAMAGNCKILLIQSKAMTRKEEGFP